MELNGVNFKIKHFDFQMHENWRINHWRGFDVIRLWLDSLSLARKFTNKKIGHLWFINYESLMFRSLIFMHLSVPDLPRTWRGFRPGYPALFPNRRSGDPYFWQWKLTVKTHLLLYSIHIFLLLFHCFDILVAAKKFWTFEIQKNSTLMWHPYTE